MGKSLQQRWAQTRPHVDLLDLGWDGLGKFLLGLGVGILGAPGATPVCPWYSLALGGAMILFVKGKYWRRFWS